MCHASKAFHRCLILVDCIFQYVYIYINSYAPTMKWGYIGAAAIVVSSTCPSKIIIFCSVCVIKYNVSLPETKIMSIYHIIGANISLVFFFSHVVD